MHLLFARYGFSSSWPLSVLDRTPFSSLLWSGNQRVFYACCKQESWMVSKDQIWFSSKMKIFSLKKTPPWKCCHLALALPHVFLGNYHRSFRKHQFWHFSWRFKQGYERTGYGDLYLLKHLSFFATLGTICKGSDLLTMPPGIVTMWKHPL